MIATGGSVIYADLALAYLQSNSHLVYLRATIETLQARIDNWSSRGIATAPGQSFTALYNEREPLYRHYADSTIDADGSDLNALAAVVDQIERI